MAYDIFRDQGLDTVIPVLKALLPLAGHPNSTMHSLVQGWAMRRGYIVLASSTSKAHMHESITVPFAAMPVTVFAALDSLAWMASWCPPCQDRNDGFGIFNGMYNNASRGGEMLDAMTEVMRHSCRSIHDLDTTYR